MKNKDELLKKLTSVAQILEIVLAVLVIIGVMVGLKDIFTYRLWKYPWAAHLALSAVFFVSTVLLHYIPSRAITSKYPVENIRSLGR